MLALDVLAVVRSRSSDPETVLSLADEGMRIARELDFTPGVYWALWTMGEVARLQGDHDRALGHYEEMLALWKVAVDETRGIIEGPWA